MLISHGISDLLSCDFLKLVIYIPFLVLIELTATLIKAGSWCQGGHPNCFQVLEVHLALEQLAELLAEIFEQLLLFVWNNAALKESIVYPYLKSIT